MPLSVKPVFVFRQSGGKVTPSKILETLVKNEPIKDEDHGNGNVFQQSDLTTSSIKVEPRRSTNSKHSDNINMPVKFAGPWQCYKCGFIDAIKDVVKSHMKSEHGIVQKPGGAPNYGPGRKHQCQKCKVMFKTGFALKVHICDDETMVKCYGDNCDYKITAKYLHVMERHVKRKHDVPETSDHLCTVCGKAFNLLHALDSHMRLVHYNKAGRMCFSCGHMFQSVKSINAHVKEVHGRDSNRSSTDGWRCESCDFEASDFPSLRSHLKENHKWEDSPKRHWKYTGPLSGKLVKRVANIQCEHCPAKFMWINAKKKHVNKYHEKLEVFECNVCDKVLYSRYDLMKHSDIHTNPDDYTCKKCGKIFSNVQVLKRHVKYIHEESGVTCHICGNRFASPNTLSAHVRMVHDKHRHIKCNYCDHRVSYKRDWEKHMVKMHPEIDHTREEPAKDYSKTAHKFRSYHTTKVVKVAKPEDGEIAEQVGIIQQI